MLPDSLLGRPEVDHAALWACLRRLLDRLVTALDRSAFLDESLDAVVDLLGADRGLVLLTDSSGGACAVNARGPGRALLPIEREEVSRTIILKAQQTGKHVVYEADRERSGSDSIAALGITAALAAPLRPMGWSTASGGPLDREPLRGVLYVDLRDPRKRLTELHLEFFRAAAALVSVVLEERRRFESVREDLREALAKAAPGPTPPDLEELLRPASMDRTRREVLSCLNGDSPVLLMGESGTGKTLLAHAMAVASRRVPVVRTVLGASDDLNTITSELFGHERGAYSGALTRRTGLVEFADNGTLILDEILNLAPHAQQLLLDFTQFGTYRPLGHDRPEPKRSRVRLIAVTNGDMEAALAEGRFRRDLYYRLAAVTLRLPALRERRQEIPSLAEGHLRRADPARSWRLSLPLRRLLISERLSWPGNLRQLESAMLRARERAAAADPAAENLGPEHLQAEDLGIASLAIAPGASGVPSEGGAIEAGAGDAWRKLQRERARLEDHERDLIAQTVLKHAGVVSRAAEELGLARTGLLSRMKTLGVERPGGPSPRRGGS